MSQHTYEEIREVVIDILLKRLAVYTRPNQYVNLKNGVAEIFSRRETPPGQPHPHPGNCQLSFQDAELVRDVFWDLFRQGFITLGMNDSNEEWPFFRLSHFGEQALSTESPYRFHDTNSFLGLVKHDIPDISSEAIVYLREAVAAFHAGCHLSACVMLGVAAEAEFLRLAEMAAKSHAYGQRFVAMAKENLIRRKILKFHDCLKPIIPALGNSKATEDLETNFLAIQSVLRIARNDAGHPTGSTPQREQVYVYLQLFVPFARQLMLLRQEFASTEHNPGGAESP